MPIEASDKTGTKAFDMKKKHAMASVNLLLAQHLIDVELYQHGQPDTGISSEAMSAVTSYINECYQRIAAGASGSRPNKRRPTVVSASKAAQSAVRSLMATDEPAKHFARKRARAEKPSRSEVINKAVREMKYGTGKGASLDAIETYIGAQYKVDAEVLAQASAAGAKRKAPAAAVAGPPAQMPKSAIAKGRKAPAAAADK